MINLKYTENILSNSESESLKQHPVFLYISFSLVKVEEADNPGRLYG